MYTYTTFIMRTYRRAFVNSYTYLRVLLEVLYAWVYHLLGVYSITFFFGLDKFDSPLMSTRCLEIHFLWLKFTERLCCDKGILKIKVIISALCVSRGLFRLTHACSQFWFRRLSWLREIRVILMGVLWSSEFRFRCGSWVSLWLGNHS